MTCLYCLEVLRFTDNAPRLVKIGITETDIDSLHRRFNSSDLERIAILDWRYFDTREAARQREKELHALYAEFRYRGEKILTSGNREIFEGIPAADTDILGEKDDDQA